MLKETITVELTEEQVEIILQSLALADIRKIWWDEYDKIPTSWMPMAQDSAMEELKEKQIQDWLPLNAEQASHIALYGPIGPVFIDGTWGALVSRRFTNLRDHIDSATDGSGFHKFRGM